MAQNSRIAISDQNSMARSTTSIESNSSHERSRIEVPREPPDIDFVSSANGDTIHPDRLLLIYLETFKYLTQIYYKLLSHMCHQRFQTT